MLLQLLLACAFVACRTATEGYRSVTYEADSRNAEERLESIIGSYPDWHTFSAKGKIKISGGEEMSASMQMRMIADRYIYVSLRGGMGIEGGKIFITPDSLFIVDKINKCYLADKISTFTGGVELSLGDFQNLLLCRMFGLSFKVIGADGNGCFEASSEIDGKAVCNFSFDECNMLRSADMSGNGHISACRVGYDDYIETMQNGCVMATSVSIVSRLQESSVAMSVTYSPASIAWDKPIDDTFAVNGNYRRIDAQLLLQQLGKEL